MAKIRADAWRINKGGNGVEFFVEASDLHWNIPETLVLVRKTQNLLTRTQDFVSKTQDSFTRIRIQSERPRTLTKRLEI